VSSPEVVALEDPATLGALTRDWDELALRLDESSYFQSAAWVLSWWETIAGRPPTRLVAWRGSSGRLEALVALSEDRTVLHPALPVDLPVHVNAGSGPGDADHCGWLVPPERRTEVAGWLAHNLTGAGLLLRDADPAWGHPPLPARARVIAVTTCPRMILPGPDEAVGRSPGLRRQLPRFTRRLEREGVRFEWVPPGQVDEPLLRALFALHRRARAGRVAGTDFGAEHLDLHLRLAARGEPGCGPAAVVARHDGVAVGILYGFWWKDTFAAYQWGWDPAWAHFSMGSVLTYHAIRFAARDGARILDFLRGTEPYKYRFGAVDRHDRTWIAPHGPAGLLLSTRYRARDRIRPDRRPVPSASA
jgi:CelD/BcsL family acetyltransferase involved in cellulose biosynthesis